jgi:hypothetical protein
MEFFSKMICFNIKLEYSSITNFTFNPYISAYFYSGYWVLCGYYIHNLKLIFQSKVYYYHEMHYYFFHTNDFDHHNFFCFIEPYKQSGPCQKLEKILFLI